MQQKCGDAQLEAEALSNLGGVMMQARVYRPALVAFDAAIRRNPPARLAIPALGGAMLMSARLGDAPRARERYGTLTRYAAASDHRWEVTDALIDAATALFLMGDAAESERVRQRALKLASENGIQVRPASRVLVTAGGNQAFMNAVLAVTDPGDEIILPAPYYFNHEMAIVMAGARAVAVPTDDQYQLDVPAIAPALC